MSELRFVKKDAVPRLTSRGRQFGKWALAALEFIASGEEAAEVVLGDAQIKSVAQTLYRGIREKGWPLEVKIRVGKLYLIRKEEEGK